MVIVPLVVDMGVYLALTSCTIFSRERGRIMASENCGAPADARRRSLFGSNGHALPRHPSPKGQADPPCDLILGQG